MKKILILWLAAITVHLTAFADEVKMLSFALTDSTNTYDAFCIGDSYIDVQVPQGTNLSDMTAVFTHDGARVVVKGVDQVSGVSKHDFSDFTNPIRFIVADTANNVHAYTVRLFNLPIVFVETDEGNEIANREDWLPSSFTIRMTNGTIDSLGTANIKGRGNTSWTMQEKKPYTFKLDKKQKVLGMPKHKRWHLLSTFGNSMSYLRDDIMHWIARQTASLGWAPQGRHVELFVNGEHKGLYWLCEKISIDNNRVNITELTPQDNDSVSVTGGYLLEFADTEEPGFTSEEFGLRYRINNPDEEITDAQFNYIQGYINNLETCLMDDERLARHEYEDYLDVDTWIDYWFMHELATGTDIGLPGLYEGLSCFCYKDRGGKLKAGPVWDMHLWAKSGVGYHAKDKLYYTRLFNDMQFVNRVKEKWYGSDEETSLPDLINGYEERVDSIAALIQQAGDRDQAMWNKNETVAYQADRVKARISNNIRWMNYCVIDLPYVTGLNVPTGVANTNTTHVTASGIYTIYGVRISSPQPGINIVRKDDGSIVKVLVK